MAYLIDKELPGTLLRIKAAADSAAAEPRVVRQQPKEIIDNGGNHVIATQSLIQRRIRSFVRHGGEL
jgi:hypothetical protein